VADLSPMRRTRIYRDRRIWTARAAKLEQSQASPKKIAPLALTTPMKTGLEGHAPRSLDPAATSSKTMQPGHNRHRREPNVSDFALHGRCSNEYKPGPSGRRGCMDEIKGLRITPSSKALTGARTSWLFRHLWMERRCQSRALMSKRAPIRSEDERRLSLGDPVRSSVEAQSNSEGAKLDRRSSLAAASRDERRRVREESTQQQTPMDQRIDISRARGFSHAGKGSEWVLASALDTRACARLKMLVEAFSTDTRASPLVKASQSTFGHLKPSGITLIGPVG